MCVVSSVSLVKLLMPLAIFSMHVLSKACIHSLHLRKVHLHVRLKEFHHFYLRVTVAPGGRVKCIAVKGESRPPVFKVSLGARSIYRIFLFRECNVIQKSSTCLPVFVRSRRTNGQGVTVVRRLESDRARSASTPVTLSPEDNHWSCLD